MPAAQPVSVPVVPLAQIVRRMGLHHLDITGAHVKADGLPQGPFELVDGTASTMAYPCLWNHDDTRERRLRVDPDSHCRIRQVRGRIPATLTERAELRWATATRAHYGCDLRFNSQSIIVAMTEQPTLRGRAWPWPSVVFDDPQHEVVFALWANSTLGLVCHWWMSNKSQIGRGTTTVTSIAAMAVLDVRQLSDDRLMKAAAQFETVKDRRFLPFDQLDEDEARADLDRRLLVSVLGLPGGLCEPNGAMERLRRKLSIEPRQLQYARTLASRFKQLDRGDQAWRGFVNNDAWALARLQARRRKFAPGLMNLRSAIPMLRHPFGTGAPLPKWARVLISGAKQKNTARWNALTPLCRSSNVASARRAMLGIPVSLVILPRVSHFFRLST